MTGKRILLLSSPFLLLIVIRAIIMLVKAIGPWFLEALSNMRTLHRSVEALRQSTQEVPGGPARATKGTFEERFPLLTRCLAGQPQEAQVGLKAHYRKVSVNFEFLLSARPEAIPQLLQEARFRSLVAWTGSTVSGPVVYGAGLVRPAAIEETRLWLAAAGAIGQKLTIAFRDGEGMPRIIEHHFRPASEDSPQPRYGGK